MKKRFLITIGGLLTAWGCQTESLNIQRSFPFSLRLDAFPAAVTRLQPTSVGFGVRPDYVTADNAYTFSWQVAAPLKGVLMLNKKVIAPGGKIGVSANISRLLSDTLTYMPTDSGSHKLTFRVFDSMGQAKDTTFTVTVVK